ncbi:hypothetical protein ACSU1N_05080 [Thermogladius sp. 4427co]|uniref:hypothetical protein n=1 Tax=Thermogladius sp. 4427co TaxID=3450718 RepID=UPI003F7B07F1
MSTDRVIKVFMLLTLLTGAASALVVSAQSISSTYVVISYDPLAGSGIVSYNLTFDNMLTTPVNLSLDLIAGENITVVNVTASDGTPLPYSLSGNTLSILVNGTTAVSVYYIVNNLMPELVPGSYSMTLDSSRLYGNVNIVIRVPGLYNVTCIGSGCSFRIDTSSNTTEVLINQKGLDVITLTTLTTSTPQQTTTTPAIYTYTSQPTGLVTTTPTSTPQTGLPPGSTTSMTSPSQQGVGVPGQLIIPVAIIVVLIVVILVLLLRWR